MTLLELASWSNCPLETIERLCNRGFQEPALVGAFFDTPIAFSKWVQRPATHQECDFLFRCQSHAQSIVDDSVVRASSVRSDSSRVAAKRVLEEASGPLICGDNNASLAQRIGVQGTKRRRLWMPRSRKKTFRGSRKARLVGNLLHSFDVFGFASKLYKDFSVLPDNLKKQHRDLMRERLSSFSSSALASSCYALSRWLQWARGQGLNPFPVAPLSFALWLRSFSLEFWTSASSAFSALRWLENHLGFV